MKIVAISDTHNRHNQLVIHECDVLISVGDYSFKGYDSEVKNFHKWMNKQPARHKISIQGNHEIIVQENWEWAKGIAKEQCPDVHFVDHHLVEIEGVKFFCSAWTPEFHMWGWNAGRTPEDALRLGIPYIKDKWKDIPQNVDVIATHGPSHGILDQVYQVDGVTPRERVGCWHLLERVLQTNAKVVLNGHIHGDAGYKEFMGKHFYNVAICGETYAVDREPTIIEL